MTAYSVWISRTAEHQLKKLPVDDQARVARALRALATDPFSHRCRKLAGHDGVFRIRIGPHRVLYSVRADALVVVVLKIGHRKDVYRGSLVLALVPQALPESPALQILDESGGTCRIGYDQRTGPNATTAIGARQGVPDAIDPEVPEYAVLAVVPDHRPGRRRARESESIRR